MVVLSSRLWIAPRRHDRVPSWTGFLALALGLLLALPVMAGDSGVEFPGPILKTIFGAPLSAQRVPWSDGASDHLVVGDDLGYLNIIYHLGDNTRYQILDRIPVPGQVVALEAWPEGPFGERTLVAATTNPDRILFLKVQYSQPLISVLQTVSLPEDPGTMVFLDPTQQGDARLAVSLPGWDSIALLQQADGLWSLTEHLPAGDEPFALAALDWDDDGRLDLLSAERGALSGSLGVYKLDQEDSYRRVDDWELEGTVQGLAAGDFDLDGKDEFLVSYADLPRLDAYSAWTGSPILQQSISLAFAPDRIRTFTLFNGNSALVSSVEARGLVEFLEFTGDSWQQRDSYYTGCNPVDVVPGDLNGDGYQELNCLGASTETVAILLGNSRPGFWGYPARPLGTTPLNLEGGDFDGDGDRDLVLGGLEPAQLVFYRREEGFGPLDQARVQDLAFLPGPLCAADFMGAGADELAMVDLLRGGVCLLGLGAEGAFEELVFLELETLPSRIRSGDIDGDGHQDLLLVMSNSSAVWLFYGDGLGQFSGPVVLDLPLGLYDARPLRMNDDPWAELVATDATSRVWVAPNETGRTFGSPVAYQAGSGARLLDLGDLDGDLDDDVIVANTSGETITLLENTGDGALVRRVGALSLDGEPRQMVARDLNEDGLVDILVTLGQGEGQRILLGFEPWLFESALSIFSTGSVYRTYLDDFNDDLRLDILNLDSTLKLGVVLQNTALVFVSAEEPGLEVGCLNDRWEVWLRPEPGQGWTLWGDDGTVRQELARDGLAAVGDLESFGDEWRLSLDPAQWFGKPAGLHLELHSAGRLYQAGAPAPCGASALPRLRWQTLPWPNPFNPRLEARIRLDRPSWVRATVHDLAGREVATLLEGALTAGVHPIAWDGRGRGRAVAAGVYFLQVSTEQGQISHKIVLVK